MCDLLYFNYVELKLFSDYSSFTFSIQISESYLSASYVNL